MSTSPAEPAAQVAGIADLTYRNYDGPLQTRTARWWVVALSVVRTNLRKPGFWVLAGIILLIYLFNGLIFYVTRNVSNVMGGANRQTLTYAGTAYQCVNASSLLVFLAALVVGAGSIAADNRANALLVYLAKPLTKGDYLLGKWAGVFLLLAGIALAPALLLYLFFLTAYYNDGFLKENPWLFVRLAGTALLPPLLNASLIVGFSAWSNNPRLAGAIYAGFYFITQALTGTAGFLLFRNALLDEDLGARPAVVVRAVTIQHASVRGVADGLGLALMRVHPRDLPFFGPRRFRRRMQPPAPLPLALLGIALIAVPLAAARARIRAVEVVRG